MQRLSDDSYLMAFMPEKHGAAIDLATGRYKLLIIPGDVARTDGLRIHHLYLASPKRDGTARSPNAGIIVKVNGVTEENRKTFQHWLASYEDAWSTLPAP